jgi:DNA-binding NarL/FixJ family response regulator
MTLRVFLVDDHELMRVGLRTIMSAEPDLEVVGEAATAADAVGRIAAARPDVAVVDLQLGATSGIEVCRNVRSRCPEVRCLVLSAFSDERDVAAAVMAGAAGYVLKQRANRERIDTIRAIARGDTVLDPALVQDVVARFRAYSGPEALLERLSAQERRILDRIAGGRTNRQIAEELSLAEKTVRNYVSNLLAKLGMHRRSEAAAFAARLEGRRESGPRR